MNRETLRRLERRTRAHYTTPGALQTLRKRARKACPNEDPETLDTRLRLALANLNDLPPLPTLDDLPPLPTLDDLPPLPTLDELTDGIPDVLEGL